MTKNKSSMVNSKYLTGEELEQRIAETNDNDRSLVRYSRWSRKYSFPECHNCGAPKLAHKTMDFNKCALLPFEQKR